MVSVGHFLGQAQCHVMIICKTALSLYSAGLSAASCFSQLNREQARVIIPLQIHVNVSELLSMLEQLEKLFIGSIRIAVYIY